MNIIGKDIIRLLILKYCDVEASLNLMKSCKYLYNIVNSKEKRIIQRKRASLSLKRIQEDNYKERFENMYNFLSSANSTNTHHAINTKGFAKTLRDYKNGKMMRCPGCNKHIHKKGYKRHLRRKKCHPSNEGCTRCDIIFTGAQYIEINYFSGQFANHQTSLCPMDEKKIFCCPNISFYEHLEESEIYKKGFYMFGTNTSQLYHQWCFSDKRNVKSRCNFTGTLYEVKRHLIKCVFSCLICNKSFKGNSNSHLQEHKNISLKTFCSLFGCPFETSKNDELYNHKIICPLYKIKCDYCDKKFIHSWNLSNYFSHCFSHFKTETKNEI